MKSEYLISAFGKVCFKITQVLILASLCWLISLTNAYANTNFQSLPCPICPSDLIVPVEPGKCGAVIELPSLNTSGCPGNTFVSSYTPPSGSLFPVGTTSVTGTVTLNNRIIGQCTFNVTVFDNQPPTINCLPDIKATAAAGSNSAIVNFPAPMVRDNCSNTKVTISPPAGSSFKIGTTVVNVSAVDASGNKATCQFNVIVIDRERPLIDCPKDLTVTAQSGECSTIVKYPPLTGNDNSGNVNITFTPASGSRLPVGKNIVTATATDRSGNSATCSFVVMVVSADDLKIDCPGELVMTAPIGACGMAVNFSLPTTNGCAGTTVTSSPAPGSYFPLGSSKVNLIAVDPTGKKATCIFNIKVMSAQPPQIQCPANIIVDATRDNCMARVTYPPITVDNSCTDTKIEYSIPQGSAFAIGDTPVNVTVTDASGRVSNCQFNVKVIGKPELTFEYDSTNLVLDFGPISALRKSKKRLPFHILKLENIGCAPASILFSSMLRTGEAVDTQRITNPDDQDLFILRSQVDNSNSRINMGSSLSLKAKEQRSVYLLFQPLIPPVNTGTQTLLARQVLPETMKSLFTMKLDENRSVEVNLQGRVTTEIRLIDPIEPRLPASAIFNRNGNEYSVEFSVYDANLNVERAIFQFFNNAGSPIDSPIIVDLKASIQASQLLKGQSFTVIQKFTGANDHPKYSSVRVTVFDDLTSATVTSNMLGNTTSTTTSPMSDMVQDSVNSKLILPVIDLAPVY